MDLFASFRAWVKSRIDQPVSIQRKQMADMEGMTWWDGENWQIRISADRSEQGQVDILLHELAHVLSNQWHGKKWGIAYARCYKDYYLPWTESDDPV